MAPEPSNSGTQHVLVTGATGFIGRHLVAALAAAGHRVRALVRRPGSVRLASPEVEVLRGDVTDTQILARAVEGIDRVFHLAAALKPAHLPLAHYRAVNVRATAQLLEACAAAGVRRFVYASSVAVLGNCRAGEVMDEATPPPTPREKYAISKFEAEAVVRAANGQGLTTVIARPEWVYGPYSAATEKLFSAIGRGRFVMIGRGVNTHQPIWVGDVVDALCRCGEAGKGGHTYNLVGPEPLPLRHECELIAAAMGSRLAPFFIPFAVVDAAAACAELAYGAIGRIPPVNRRQVAFFADHRAYRLDKVQADLDWLPTTTFAEGARKTAAWLRSRAELDL